MPTTENMPNELGDLSLTQLGVGAHTTLPQAERELLTAILEDAIRSYRKYAFSGTRRGRRLFREVQAWFIEPPTADVAVPFDYVCEMLDLAPDPIRQALERWRAHAFAGEEAAARLVESQVEECRGMPLAPLARTTRARSRRRVVPSVWKVVGGR